MMSTSFSFPIGRMPDGSLCILTEAPLGVPIEDAGVAEGTIDGQPSIAMKSDTLLKWMKENPSRFKIRPAQRTESFGINFNS